MVENLKFILFFEIHIECHAFVPDMADMEMENQLTMLQDSANGLLRFVLLHRSSKIFQGLMSFSL